MATGHERSAVIELQNAVQSAPDAPRVRLINEFTARYPETAVCLKTNRSRPVPPGGAAQ